jgi:uncharacterized protein (TIGR03083 family)
VDRNLYLAAIIDNGAAIARAIQTAPNASVPTCPDWRLRDLGFHVACVLHFWSDVMLRAGRKPPPLGTGMTPPEDTGLERFVRAELDALMDVLHDANHDRPAWTWWGEPNARNIPRRIAQETTIHRWDATNAIGEPDPIAPPFAADGVSEFYRVLMPDDRVPPKGLVGSIALDTTDVDCHWLINLETETPPGITTTSTTAGARGSLRGTAEQLLLVLWRRLPLADAEISGDRDLIRRLIEYPNLT